MPVKRRIAKHRSAPFDRSTALMLIRSGPTAGEDVDAERLQQHWKENRSGILPAYVAKFPGLRPWAWWMFDAPDDRGEETSIEYLSRHKLLSAKERKAIASGLSPRESELFLRIAADKESRRRLFDYMNFEETLATTAASFGAHN